MLAFLAACAFVGEPDLKWMSGVWSGDVWGGRMEEHWTVPSGNTLMGFNRMVKDGVTAHREFLSIETQEGKTVMTVFIARKVDAPLAPVPYALSESAPNRAVFVNPEHERLSRIVYVREGVNMKIRLEGKRNDKAFADDIVLKLEEKG